MNPISSACENYSQGSQNKDLDPQDQEISSIKQETLGQSVEEQLEGLFKSSKKTQKLFSIDQNKVGVIFNPEGESLKIGVMTVKDSVVLVSEKSLPEEVINRITQKIPPSYSYSVLSFGSINGQPTLEFLGF